MLRKELLGYGQTHHLFRVFNTTSSAGGVADTVDLYRSLNELIPLPNWALIFL